MEKRELEVPTVYQLERMTTHELADLLALLVLALRRLPNIPVEDLKQERGEAE